MESYKKKRDEEMEEMLKKIQEHQEHIVKVGISQRSGSLLIRIQVLNNRSERKHFIERIHIEKINLKFN